MICQKVYYKFENDYIDSIIIFANNVEGIIEVAKQHIENQHAKFEHFSNDVRFITNSDCLVQIPVISDSLYYLLTN
jgi:hypothetical protein